jgi:GNAT superfamily N-acetyltransferase
VTCADQVRFRQLARPGEVTPALRRSLAECWAAVSDAGGAVGFLPPADRAAIAAAVDELAGGLSPQRRRLIAALAGPELAGWLGIYREPSPLMAHWATVRHVQAHPAFRGRGVGRGLLTTARRVAREEMGLEQLHLALRAGTGLERFYARLGWRAVGSWPGALRVGPGDDRDEILMFLGPL